MSFSKPAVAAALVLVPAAAWLLHGALAVGDGRAAAPAASEATRTLRLADGSRLVVPARPVRVFPANASTLDFAVDLLAPERIVALPRTAFDYSTLERDQARWRDLPRVERFASEPILALAPDLVLTHPTQDRGTIERLRASGVCVFDVPVATDWDELLTAVEIVARVLGEEERGRELARRMEQRRARIDPGVARGRRALPYGNYGAAGYTAGQGTTWDLMIELAGLANAASSAGLKGNKEIDYEQILVIDPELFVVGTGEPGGFSPTATLLRNEESLAGLDAIRLGRIVVLADELYSTASHRLLDAAEELARRARESFEER